MRILCPLCGYGREIDEAKVPPRAQMATCPKCAHKFRFRVVDDLEPLAVAKAPGTMPGSATAAVPPPVNTTGSFPSGQDLSASQPDPMAAQRLAADLAWKRLQGQKPGDAASAGQNQRVPAAQQGAPAPDSSALNSQVNDVQANAAQDNPEHKGPASTGSSVPFEDLPRYGFFPGIWGTIRQVTMTPVAFFRAMPTHAGMAKPLAFHILLAELMVVCQYLWSMAGIGATAEYLGKPEVMDMGLGLAQAAPLMLFLIYPLLLVLRVMIVTGIIHVLLRLIRSGDSGAEATFRVLCYSAAPLLLGVIPAIGPLVGGVWSIGLTVIGLKVAHKTRTSAALFAVLVPILMMLAAVIGLLQGMLQAG
ncbi:YIP1 family protein [Humidesulfovibrio idahonensis]